MIEKGKCYFMDAEGPKELNQGDLLFLPNGAPHVMGDRPDTLSIPFLETSSRLEGPYSLLCSMVGADKEPS